MENSNEINVNDEVNVNIDPRIKKSNLKLFIGLLAIVVLIGIGVNITGNMVSEKQTQVVLKTNHGDIKIALYDDMPITTGNFKSLTEKGTYNGVIFHRIIDGFMIQGGDPTGTGFGDKSIPNIKDEFTHAGGNKNNRGTIAMANAGPNTGSSQFFINLVDNNFLDDKHPAFGEVMKGMDVVDKIAKIKTGAQDRPVEEVKILEAKLI
jgi:peptidylprolyl isomerase